VRRANVVAEAVKVIAIMGAYQAPESEQLFRLQRTDPVVPGVRDHGDIVVEPA